MTIHVFLADDHTIMRNGMRLLIDGQPDFKVVGEAANGREAVQEIQRLHPDVVIMDMAMPQLNGVEATRQIRESSPSTKVVMLSMHSTSEHVFQAFRAGALGYVLKEAASTELLEAVRAAYAGRRYVSQRLTEIGVDDRRLQSKSPLERLTERERQVLQLTVEGKSSAEIADILSLSPKSVATYRSRLMHKLSLDDLPSLVKFAVQHGLTPLT
jgi:DNA-binding NarL/FixJ family response regulator